jgi:hypothetical protein
MTSPIVVRELKRRYLRDAKKYKNNPSKLAEIRKAHMEALRMHLYFDPIEPPVPTTPPAEDAVVSKGCCWMKFN